MDEIKTGEIPISECYLPTQEDLDQDDYVHVKETDVNQLEPVPDEVPLADLQKKPKYANKLAEAWNECLFGRIRAGIFNGFRGLQRKRHRGTSAMTTGREIERLKDLGQTPAKGRVRLAMAHGLGSLQVESDAVELARLGKYQDAIKLLESWTPHYDRHQERKAFRLDLWRARLLVQS